VSTVFLQHTHVSSGGLAREQENPEVRGGIGIANQSGSIVSSHKSTTSSSSYSSLIVQARPQHLEETPGPPPPIEPVRSLYTGTSLPWQSRLPPPRVTMRNTSPTILHPLQPFPASFVTHGISSPSSTSHRQSCSPREFTFHPFSSTTKATPRFALTH
jgi:hypothetical protein